MQRQVPVLWKFPRLKTKKAVAFNHRDHCCDSWGPKESDMTERLNRTELNWMSSLDFPGGSDSKASVYNVGDLGSIPGLGRFPGAGNGNPLQYSSRKSYGQRSLVSMGSQRVWHDWATSLSHDINRQIWKYFWLHENIINQKLWDAAKVMLLVNV